MAFIQTGLESHTSYLCIFTGWFLLYSAVPPACVNESASEDSTNS
jgi:hypothetical protein